MSVRLLGSDLIYNSKENKIAVFLFKMIKKFCSYINNENAFTTVRYDHKLLAVKLMACVLPLALKQLILKEITLDMFLLLCPVNC